MDKIALAGAALVASYVAFDVARDGWRRLRRWRACRKGHRFEWARIWDDYAVDPIGVGVVCSRCGERAGCRADWPDEPDWVQEFRTLKHPGKLESMVKRVARDEAFEVLEEVEHADRSAG